MKTTYEAVTNPEPSNAMEMTTQQWILNRQGQNDESLEVARDKNQTLDDAWSTRTIPSFQ